MAVGLNLQDVISQGPAQRLIDQEATNKLLQSSEGAAQRLLGQQAAKGFSQSPAGAPNNQNPYQPSPGTYAAPEINNQRPLPVSANLQELFSPGPTQRLLGQQAADRLSQVYGEHPNQKPLPLSADLQGLFSPGPMQRLENQQVADRLAMDYGQGLPGHPVSPKKRYRPSPGTQLPTQLPGTVNNLPDLYTSMQQRFLSGEQIAGNWPESIGQVSNLPGHPVNPYKPRYQPSPGTHIPTPASTYRPSPGTYAAPTYRPSPGTYAAPEVNNLPNINTNMQQRFLLGGPIALSPYERAVGPETAQAVQNILAGNFEDFVGPVEVSDTEGLQEVSATGEGVNKQQGLYLPSPNRLLEDAPINRLLEDAPVSTGSTESQQMPQTKDQGPPSGTRKPPSEDQQAPQEEPGFFGKLVQGLKSMGKGFTDAGKQLINTPEGRQALWQLGQLVSGEKVTPFGPTQSELQKRAVGDLVSGRSPETALSSGLSPQNQQAAIQAAQRQQALDLKKAEFVQSTQKPEGMNSADWNDLLQQTVGEFFNTYRESLPEDVQNITDFMQQIQGPEGRIVSEKMYGMLSDEAQSTWKQAIAIGEATFRNTGSQSAAGIAMRNYVKGGVIPGQGSKQGKGTEQSKGTEQGKEKASQSEGTEKGPITINTLDEFNALDNNTEFTSQGQNFIKRNGQMFPLRWQ